MGVIFFKAFPDMSQNGLKKLFYNNKMSTYAELMEIIKWNESKGYYHYSKSKLIDLSVKRWLILKNLELINKKKKTRI